MFFRKFHHEDCGCSRALHNRVVVNCQYSMVVLSTGERKRRPRGDRKSQEMSQHLKQTFEATIKTELYPRSQIDIFVEVLQADGGNYCACVKAATLASPWWTTCPPTLPAWWCTLPWHFQHLFQIQ
jgi:exosome complex component RRP41